MSVLIIITHGTVVMETKRTKFDEKNLIPFAQREIFHDHESNATKHC